MSKETREHLSCLMDGELSSDAGRFVARRMGGDEALCDTWQRYHLIRDCLRRPGEALVLTQLSVDLEAAAPPPAATGSGRRPGMPGWLRPLAGGAIAASVAAAAVLVAINLQVPVEGPAGESFASPNTIRFNEPPISQAASFNPASAASQRSLNRYLMRHNQASGAMGQKGFLPYIPVVAGSAETVIETDAAALEAADSASDAGRDEP